MNVSGTVVEAESGRPLKGLRVRAFDKDLVFDDDLGECVTDAAGRFEVRFTEAQYRDWSETAPDLYIRVFDASGERLLYTTEQAPRMNGAVQETFEVRISAARLR
ncbi:MAG: hypothetical protein IPK00_05770 [Deltaproteobacteria bacterium]|nr:hypothetical protein [Deltaproteobacteria bacterium]